MKKFKIKGKVFVFQMEAAWFYINVPLDMVPNVPKAGWGSVPVTVKIGKTSWDTSIFPMKRDNYFIPIKKAVRKKEDIFEGDEITVEYFVRKK